VGSNPSPPISLRINVFGAATYFKRAVNPLPAPISPKRWRYNSTVERTPGVACCGVVFCSTQSNTLGKWA
jgi:hypothetical protein